MLVDRLERIEEKARDGLEQVGFTEVGHCHKCSEARFVRYGVQTIAEALWELRLLIRELRTAP